RNADSTLPHLWPTGSSWVPPLITARYFSSCPSDSISRWTPCPPKYYKQWLQVRLGCIQLSPLCPFGRLHTFCFLRPARFYPRFRIWRSSFERQRDFNPPEQHAAQLALLSRETLSFSASCRFIPAHCNRDFSTVDSNQIGQYWRCGQSIAQSSAARTLALQTASGQRKR